MIIAQMCLIWRVAHKKDQNTLETYIANNVRIQTNGRTAILKQ